MVSEDLRNEIGLFAERCNLVNGKRLAHRWIIHALTSQVRRRHYRAGA
jgi:hypothetical protein